MRDLHLRHTLKQLARDASAVFAEIVDGGQEIPYEIAEAGDAFAFCQYKPLTANFVRDNATELRELESFREATETMRRSDLAGSYLQEAGIMPPADAVERSTLAVTYFLARLWDGCSDFEIDEDRFSAALEEVEQCAEPEAGEVEAIVPLLGFQMPATRVELKGASIVRADTVDVPPEVARSENTSDASWEPSFVISARISLDANDGLSGAADQVARTFERVVTTLRLLKRGSVGLGPHGWVRVAGDRWRRISTGAGRPRSGGYRLAEEELPELIDLARLVAVHPKRVARLRRPLLRFESGLDRRGAVDALNDHLLGLRFLLEGEGPAGTGLPMRAAALAAHGEERAAIKETVDQAIALEREMWSGEPAGSSSASPSQIATRLEELLRQILRGGVSGDLGADLRAAADETLLADGLAVGEGGTTQGSTTEWDLEPEPAAGVADTAAFDRFEADPEPVINAARTSEPEPEPVSVPEPEMEAPRERATEPLQDEIDGIENELNEEAPMEASHETEPEQRRPARQEPLPRRESLPRPERFAQPIGTRAEPAAPDGEQDEEPQRLEPPNWLEEVDEGPETPMEFPKANLARRENHIDELSKPPMEREEVRARVEYLFPRTETNWTVGKGEVRRKVQAG